MKNKGKKILPRQYAIVRHIPYPVEKRGPFPRGAALVFLGEIPNMPGHCVVAEVNTGRVHAGYHTERFEEVPEDQT